MKNLINISILLLVRTVPRCEDAAVSNEVAKQLKSPIPIPIKETGSLNKKIIGNK